MPKKELVAIRQNAIIANVGAELFDLFKTEQKAESRAEKAKADSADAARKQSALMVKAWLHGAENDPNVRPHLATGTASEWRGQPALFFQLLGYQHADGTLTDLGKTCFPDFDMPEERRGATWQKRKQFKDNLTTKGKRAALGAAEALDNMVTDDQIIIGEDNIVRAPAKLLPPEARPADVDDEALVPIDNTKAEGASKRSSFTAIAEAHKAKHKLTPPQAQNGNDNEVDRVAKKAVLSDEAYAELANAFIMATRTLVDRDRMKGQNKKVAENVSVQITAMLSKPVVSAE